MNKKLASILNLSNIDMLDYRIAANFLETAGDLIAELISYLTEVKEDKQIADLIKKTGLLTGGNAELFDRSIYQNE